MRIKLIWSFLATVLITVVSSALLAVYTTNTQLQFLITDYTLDAGEFMVQPFIFVQQSTDSWDETIRLFEIEQQQQQNSSRLPHSAYLGANVIGLLPYEESDLYPELNELIVGINNNPFSTIAYQLASNDIRLVIANTSRQILFDSEHALEDTTLSDDMLRYAVVLYPLATPAKTYEEYLTRLFDTRADEPIGYLIASYNAGIFQDENNLTIENIIAGLVFGGVISAAVGVLIALILSDFMMRPLRRLKRAVHKLRQGEWGSTVPDSHYEVEFAEVIDAFNQMSTDLKTQRDLRERMLGDLAHEINTPLTLMKMEVYALQENMQNPIEAAKNLDIEIDAVTELVQDIVFLASKGEHRQQLKESVNLNTLAQETVERFETLAGDQLTITYKANEQTLHINAVPDMVQRAIGNLLTNAIRHTPDSGTITVSTQLTENTAQVIVQDNGSGIPPDDLPHIFESFYRVDYARHRDIGGRGLGLSIVKQIMHDHGGDVTVESTLDEGSTFTLTFPKD